MMYYRTPDIIRYLIGQSFPQDNELEASKHDLINTKSKLTIFCDQIQKFAATFDDCIHNCIHNIPLKVRPQIKAIFWVCSHNAHVIKKQAVVKTNHI